MYRPGVIDQEKVKDDVGQVHQNIGNHGASGIARPAHDASQNDGKGAENHGRTADAEIQGRIPVQLRIRSQPHWQEGADPNHEDAQNQTERHSKIEGLNAISSGLLSFPRSDGFRDAGKHADPHGEQGGVHQPGHGAGEAHRRRGLCSQPSHHGRVDVLHQRLKRLLHHRRP